MFVICIYEVICSNCKTGFSMYGCAGEGNYLGCSNKSFQGQMFEMCTCQCNECNSVEGLKCDTVTVVAAFHNIYSIVLIVLLI